MSARRKKPNLYIKITIRDEDGQIVVNQGFTTDITERKEAQAQALDTARFLNSLLKTVPIAVFHKDRDGRYQGFNRAFEEFLDP